MVRITGKDDDDVKDDDIEDNGDAARTTGKDDDGRKGDDSKNNGDNGEDDNNDGGNDNRGGNGGGGGESVGRSVGWRGQWPWHGWWLCSSPLVAWHLHTVGIVQICLGINLFWYKFYSACLDMPNRIYSIRIYSGFILCLFWYKIGYKLFIPILVVTQ
jgi:hypothetical protein